MSIQSHSKESKELYIFSVYQSGLALTENKFNYLKVENKLKKSGIWFKVVEGYYKGYKEKSFIVNDKNVCEYYFQKYNQESYLQLSTIKAHGVRNATLHFNNNDVIELGYFRSVPKRKALKEDSYTYDNVTKNYFITIKNYNEAVGIQ